MVASIWTEKLNLAKTLAIYVSYFIPGLGLGICGPSLLDFQIQTGESDLSKVTLVIISRAIGFAVGAGVNSIICRYLKAEIIASIAMMVGGITFFILPHITSADFLIGMYLMNGIANGVTEVVANLYLMTIWKKRSAAFLQGLHLFLGLGALVSPLFVSYYLVPDEIQMEYNLNITAGIPTSVETYLYIPYSCIGGLSIIGSFVFLFIYIQFKETAVILGETTDEEKEAEASASTMPMSQRISYIFASLFTFFYCGVEISLGSYLMPFATHSQVGYPKETGALMSSTFWGFFTFCRVIVMFSISTIGTFNVLLVSICILISSNFFLTFGFDNLYVFWVGIALNGMGLSSCWGCLYGYISDYYTVTSILAFMMCSMAAVGEGIIPLVVDQFIISNPIWFLHIVSICSVSLAAIFFFLMLTLEYYKKRNGPNVKVKFQSQISWVSTSNK